MKKWLIAAGISALLGAVLFFTPLRFTGFLLVMAGLVLLLFGLLRGKKAARAVLIALLILGFGVFAVAEVQVLRYSGSRSDRQPAAVIVLGAGVYGRTPSLSLQVRLSAALSYIEDKPDVPIIVSGGQGPGEDISEAQCMADYLIGRGVDSGRIILEDKSANTQENLANSLAILEGMGIGKEEPIAVVSADYHLYRARLYWPGEDMIPVPATMDGRWWPMTLNYFIREAFGVVYLWVFGT